MRVRFVLIVFKSEKVATWEEPQCSPRVTFLPLPEWEAGSIPAGGFPCESRACNLPLTEKGSGSPWPLPFLCLHVH
nr:MAG TPA: hypothetical protein [Caudoviricetes sp.]